MAASFRSSDSANTGASSAGSLAVNVPSGVQAGDNLIANVVVSGGTAATITPPSGWTLVTTSVLNQSTNVQQAVYWHLAGASEPSSYTWNFDTTRNASINMLAYSGASQTIPSVVNTATTTQAASTSITPNSASNSYLGGYFVYCFGAENTSAASSFTGVSSGFTKVEDTCNSVANFINAMVDHKDVTNPTVIGSQGGAATTNSQTSNMTAIMIFIADSHASTTQVAVDNYAANGNSSAASNITTNLFTTYPNELILLLVSIAASNQTISSVTNGTVTFTKVVSKNTNNGDVEIWRALAPTPGTLGTVTVNFSGSVSSCDVLIVGLTGANPTGSNGANAIGATNTGTYSSAAPSLSLTSTVNNSLTFGVINNNTNTSTITPNNGNVAARNSARTSSADYILQQSSNTASAGSTVTVSGSAPTNASGNIAIVEVVPNSGHELSLLGVGA